MSLDSIFEGSHKEFLTQEFKEEFLVLNKALERFLEAIDKADKKMKRDNSHEKKRNTRANSI
jgi:hypothetical protein